VLFVTSAR